MVTRPGRPPRETVSSVLKRRVVKSAEERRQDILKAALRLFASKGFHETAVDDVAEGAGVAKGTIYLYFDSKEHVLLELKRQFHKGLEVACADVIADAIDRLSRGDKLDYRDVIDEIFDAMVDYNVRNRDAVEVVIRQTPGPELVQEAIDLELDFLQLITRAFREASDRGLIQTSDPEMMAYLINAAIRDNIVTCLCYEKPCDMDRLIAAAKELLYKALAPDFSPPPRRPRLVRSPS